MRAILLLIALTAQAAEYYASPTGSASAAGTVAAPVTLTCILEGGCISVTPVAGDTIWTRGGTYNKAFAVTRSGSEGNPITLRAFPGERPAIDCQGTSIAESMDRAALAFSTADHMSFAGFELLSSETDRTGPNQWTSDVCYGLNIYSGSTGITFRNGWIHSTAGGVSTFGTTQNVDIYGAHLWHIGFTSDASGAVGQNLYWQNDTGTKQFRHSTGHNSHNGGGQIYGSCESVVKNILVDKFASWNNGSQQTVALGGNYENNILVGKTACGTAEGVTLRSIMAYYTPGASRGSNRICYGSGCTSLTIEDSEFIGRGASTDVISETGGAACGLSAATLNNNKFYGGLVPSCFTAALGGDNTHAASIPTSGLSVRYWPNEYAPGRGLVIVHNWAQAATVEINPSTILTAGDRYEVYDAHDLLGSPISTGTYSGAFSVTTTSTAMATYYGTPVRTPIHSDSRFQVYEIRRALDAPTVTPAATSATITYRSDTSTVSHQWLFSNSQRTALVAKSTNSESAAARTWEPSGLTAATTYYYSVAAGDTSYQGSFTTSAEGGGGGGGSSAPGVSGKGKLSGKGRVR